MTGRMADGGCDGSRDHFCALRQQPLRQIPPQGDYQFARQGDDHGAADAPLAGADALLESAREIAIRLVAQPQPGKLRWRFAAHAGCPISGCLDHG
ncbi:hypothetical protein X735_32965 [Mesorhizobium sp. L2C085B000]|nr:hypothetical protein X735_32965 [Mesorhizobium sp. L2C085B000]